MSEKKKKPDYSYELAKQLLFDCAMELLYNTEGLTREQIATKILSVIKNLDCYYVAKNH